MTDLDAQLARLREIVGTGGIVGGCGRIGIELELHLIDDHGLPAPRNDAVLRGLDGSPIDAQTELARFNVEINLAPVTLTDAPLTTLRDRLRDAHDAASVAAPGTAAVSIGTLPTLTTDDIGTHAISDRARYHQLDRSIMAARDGIVQVAIDGADAGGERLDETFDTIVLEAAATSLQVHLDLAADGLVDAWNVAQAIAAVQVAVAANSPILLGRRLWHETRVPLFEQLIDVRSPAERDPTSRTHLPPRVWFGAAWITDPVELFAENLRLFRAPLIAESTGDGVGGDAGDDDRLAALVAHNGTVWRWNRPVYARGDAGPTLRIENRVLSAPPSAVDAVADIALFAGLVEGLREDIQRLTASLDFADAERNFRAAARHGLNAPLRWPGVAGSTTAGELLADRLIEVASAGLDALGVPGAESGPALDVIAARASEGRNGATWQLATLAEEELRHDRPTALARMLLRYRDLQHEGEPVHRWPWPSHGPS